MDAIRLKEELKVLAEHLHTRRREILRTWQQAVELDPQLTTSTSLSRAQFNDHIPQVLDAFENRLRAEGRDDKDQSVQQQKRSAAEHGTHRWQQGYNQRETIREWGHLQYCLLTELEAYGAAHAQLQSSVMPVARLALARLCGEGVCESAASYEVMQRAEAASRVRDLESAMRQLQDMERQRAETWREAAHDLRGSVGVISNASTLLTRDVEGDPMRAKTSQILQRSVASLRGLLSDLIDLARLEASQERRNIAPFDAAELLRDFCDNLRPMATLRNLFLKAEGAPSLPVQGDAVKVLRIAQNLLLNALNATQQGGVRVAWELRSVGGAEQWMLSVQDTGPGFLAQSAAAPLEYALQRATQEAHEVDSRSASAPTLKSQTTGASSGHAGGEGVGLSIVKRLCELLDASLELETYPGTGTTFRVVLPTIYAT